MDAVAMRLDERPPAPLAASAPGAEVVPSMAWQGYRFSESLQQSQQMLAEVARRLDSAVSVGGLCGRKTDFEDMKRQIREELESHRKAVLKEMAFVPRLAVSEVGAALDATQRQLSEEVRIEFDSWGERLSAHFESLRDALSASKLQQQEQSTHLQQERSVSIPEVHAMLVKELSQRVSRQLRHQQEFLEQATAKQAEMLRAALEPNRREPTLSEAPWQAASPTSPPRRSRAARAAGSSGGTGEAGAGSGGEATSSPASTSRALLDGLMRIGWDDSPLRGRRGTSPGAAWSGASRLH